jgi:hypothetical protein
VPTGSPREGGAEISGFRRFEFLSELAQLSLLRFSEIAFALAQLLEAFAFLYLPHGKCLCSSSGVIEGI